MGVHHEAHLRRESPEAGLRMAHFEVQDEGSIWSPCLSRHDRMKRRRGRCKLSKESVWFDCSKGKISKCFIWTESW